MNPDLKHRALRALGRREHSRAELAQKLAPHGTAEDIAALLDELQQTHLLCDARCAEAVVRAGAARLGPARLRHALRTKGIAPDLIEAALAAADGDELEHARSVWQRKFAAAPADRTEYARQARFLQGRGFSAATIRRLLKEAAA